MDPTLVSSPNPSIDILPMRQPGAVPPSPKGPLESPPADMMSRVRRGLEEL